MGYYDGSDKFQQVVAIHVDLKGGNQNILKIQGTTRPFVDPKFLKKFQVFQKKLLKMLKICH